MSNECNASSELVRKRIDDPGQLEKKQKQEHQQMPPQGKLSDVLCLNIGGTKVEVLRRTLIAVEGSLLASQFSGRWDEGLDRDSDSPAILLPLIDFLRSYSLMASEEAPRAHCPALAPPYWNSFVRMVDHYRLTSAVFPFGIFEAGVPVELPDLRIDTKVWKSFWVLPANNAPVALQSFEVILGKSSRAQIRWANAATPTRQRREFSIAVREEGVGYIQDSIALDVARGGIAIGSTAVGGSTGGAALVLVQDKRFVPIDDCPPIGEGTVIRCECNGRKFYVDGKLVASVKAESPGVTLIENLVWGTCPAPCLSVEGTVQLSSLERTY